MEKKGLETRLENGTLPIDGTRGRAYAFFNCDASKEDIERAMPDIRQYAGTPEDLELRLYEETSELEFDEKLGYEIELPGDYRIMTSEQKSNWDGEREEMPLKDLKYVLVAELPGADNRKTAEELGNVMDYVPHLNRDETVFRSAVFCEEDDGYIYRD